LNLLSSEIDQNGSGDNKLQNQQQQQQHQQNLSQMARDLYSTEINLNTNESTLGRSLSQRNSGGLRVSPTVDSIAKPVNGQRTDFESRHFRSLSARKFVTKTTTTTTMKKAKTPVETVKPLLSYKNWIDPPAKDKKASPKEEKRIDESSFWSSIRNRSRKTAIKQDSKESNSSTSSSSSSYSSSSPPSEEKSKQRDKENSDNRQIFARLAVPMSKLDKNNPETQL
jgi:hypothetical protein